MKQPPSYTLYHPKWYRKRVSTWWWAEQWRSFKFILRELSSVAVIYFVGLLLWLLWSLGRGPDKYLEFLGWMQDPLVLAFNLIAFLFVLYHSITWFNLAPKAMPIRLGGKRLPEWMIAAPNYALWVVISAALAWLILGGN
ncbi:MAG TPA: fumarate reductase subunit C [Blastocatellia bacterium]|nr:fumarate reductase subunit C [Blastocatellia bacterium]